MEKKGSALLRRLDDAFSLVNAYTGIGWVYLRQGVLPQAISLLARSLALCQTWDIQSWLHTATWNLGRAYALSGRVAEALSLLTRLP